MKKPRRSGVFTFASGSGLGLAIAQRAFEVLGGSIVAAPRAGGGLTFTIILPAADLT